MKTQVLLPSDETYALSAEILESGGLVGFPTETVYGLGANALDAQAVLSIFAAKGRPADNPLIVHIHDRSQLEPICIVPEQAWPLMDAFWPGPLTLLCVRKPFYSSASVKAFFESSGLPASQAIPIRLSSMTEPASIV